MAEDSSGTLKWYWLCGSVHKDTGGLWGGRKRACAGASSNAEIEVSDGRQLDWQFLDHPEEWLPGCIPVACPTVPKQWLLNAHGPKWTSDSSQECPQERLPHLSTEGTARASSAHRCWRRGWSLPALHAATRTSLTVLYPVWSEDLRPLTAHSGEKCMWVG